MKLNFKNSLIKAITLLCLVFISCNVNDSKPDELSLIPVNNTQIDGYTVKLSTLNFVEVGSNFLVWHIEKDGKIIEIKEMSAKPMMDMGSMEHSSPYYKAETHPENDNYYIQKVIFSMASMEDHGWTMDFDITTADNANLVGSVELEVRPSWRHTSVTDENGNSYLITWDLPSTPLVGNNLLSILVHKSEGMMDFPPYENAEIEIYPFMDMGGGEGHSTNFNNPIDEGDGFYIGDINYSMSGTWTTDVTLTTKEGETLPSVVFEYSVKAQ